MEDQARGSRPTEVRSCVPWFHAPARPPCSCTLAVNLWSSRQPAQLTCPERPSRVHVAPPLLWAPQLSAAQALLPQDMHLARTTSWP